MSFETSVKLLALLCLFGAMSQVVAQAGEPAAPVEKCQACMDNIAYCVNKTSFHLCYEDNQPDTSEIFNCDDGQECTNSANICATAQQMMDDTKIISVCSGGSGACGDCETDGILYACLSKTQYSRCVNKKPITTTSCKADEICSLESYANFTKICLPQSTADFLGFKPTCNNDVPTTAAPTTTPSTPKPDKGAIQDHCKSSCDPNNYCYAASETDTTCKSYLYCEVQGTGANAVWNYVILKCDTGIWNNVSKKCEATGECATTPAPTPTPASSPIE